MNRKHRFTAVLVTMALAAAAAGCGTQQQAGQVGTQNAQGGTRIQSHHGGQTNQLGNRGGQTQMLAGNPKDITVPVTSIGGVDYVVGTDFAKQLAYDFNWDTERSVFQMGENDAAYELKAGSTLAQRDDSQVTLAQPPMLHNSQIYIPVSAFSALFGEDFTYNMQGRNLVIHAPEQGVSGSIDGPEEANTGSELDFEDDPNDPFKGDTEGEAGAAPTLQQLSMLDDGSLTLDEAAVPVLKNINVSAMIATAKRYMGVKYLFGSGPYSKTGRFDCSTFTQYVFGKYGVTLSRTSRAQARQGTAVSRKSLRKGDLMFFYVPGRFRTNKTVGHVGIYMGNQLMIHSSPKPKNGVQITNINKAYWKETYLSARRFVY